MLCEIKIVQNKLLIVSRIHYELIFKHNIAMFLFCFYCSLYFMIIQCTKLQCISKYNIMVGWFFFIHLSCLYTFVYRIIWYRNDNLELRTYEERWSVFVESCLAYDFQGYDTYRVYYANIYLHKSIRQKAMPM